MYSMGSSIMAIIAILQVSLRAGDMERIVKTNFC